MSLPPLLCPPYCAPLPGPPLACAVQGSKDLERVTQKMEDMRRVAGGSLAELRPQLEAMEAEVGAAGACWGLGG